MYGVYNGLDVEDFIFTEGTTYEDFDDYGVSDEELNEFGIIECVDEPETACLKIALENEQNYNAIVTALMSHEITQLESGVVNESFEDIKAKLKRYAEKVKESIKKWWAKAKGIFKKLTDKISSMILSNKQFAKKFRAVANKMKSPKKKEFTGYKFPENRIINFSQIVPKISKASTKLELKTAFDEYKKSDTTLEECKKLALNEVRGTLCGKDECEASKFSEYLKEYLYGSVTTKTIAVETNFGKLLDNLEKAPYEKRDAKASYEEAEKSVKGLIKNVDEASNSVRGEEQQKFAKMIIDICNSSLTIMSTALSEQIRAITTRATQNRKMANYWVSSQKSGYSESMYEDVLDDVVII